MSGGSRRRAAASGDKGQGSAGAPLRSRVLRIGRIALPFALIAIGAVIFYFSPWPAILRLTLSRASVRVAWAGLTLTPLLLSLACWSAAVWLSLGIKAEERS